MRDGAVPYTTCAHCQSLVLREGMGAEAIGEVAVVPFDVSPVQLGTSFTVAGLPMTTVGRVRWRWSAGSWNEWFLRADDGSVRWLAEAMGMFMLTVERPDILEQPLAQILVQGGTLIPGGDLEVDGEVYVVTDVKDAQCLGSEGDLPFATLLGRQMTNVDFRAAGGGALSLQRDADGTTAWLGWWFELAGLSPKGLRAIAGWTVPEAMR